ncbi:polyprenyl synthetase family protein [Streptomyces sp. NBC_00723]|uniref:polyprenyl synthetase family protein n=1 Tax=Streptomyces sp. NBC_00723 TaxID=2903673 RepID=UPI00386588B8
MSLSPPAPSPAPAPPPTLDLHRLKEPVEQVLNSFLGQKAASTTDEGRLPNLAEPLQDFLAAGGKRIRPVLAMVGWHAAGATGNPRTAHHLAASLELFHAFALIHDDVMDRSTTRRGQPTVHCAQADQYEQRPPGAMSRRLAGTSADRFGEGAAILIGDLALVWSDELLHAGHPTADQLAHVLPLLDEMRTEVTLGQYLDLAHTGYASPDVETALTVIRYKTAKYTVERPLHLGAALTGADQTLLEALSAYAIPLGEAFQLRDDLLGVFGDPALTGKPAMDDLREGKATVLIALTLQRARRAQADQLRLFLGCRTLTEDQADAVRRIVVATDADRTVNHMITERHRKALAALDRAPVDPAAANALRRLADQAVRRTA